jgi:hypothetical protein
MKSWINLAKPGDVNKPQKTRILTSCSDNSPLDTHATIMSTLASDIKQAITKYYVRKGKDNDLIHYEDELTSGFRLLGTLIGFDKICHNILQPTT